MPSTSLVPEPHDLRASDGEREAIVESLRSHAVAGRIDPDELEQRLERAYAAQLRADLIPIVADLPPVEQQRPRPQRRREWPAMAAFAPVIALAILMVAIWAMTGAGYFWPIWPIGGVALGVLKHSRHGHRWIQA